MDSRMIGNVDRPGFRRATRHAGAVEINVRVPVAGSGIRLGAVVRTHKATLECPRNILPRDYAVDRAELTSNSLKRIELPRPQRSRICSERYVRHGYGDGKPHF